MFNSTWEKRLKESFEKFQANPKDKKVRGELLEQALEFLYRAGKGMANLAGPHISARSLVQDVVVKLLDKDEWSFESKDKFLAFCKQVLRNVLLDRLRRRQNVGEP